MPTRVRFVLATVLIPALCALALPLFATSADAAQLLRVIPGSKAEYVRLQEAAPETRECGMETQGDAVEFPAEDGRAEQLTALGFRVEVVIPDLSTFYADRIGHTRDYGGYHTYTTAIQAMDALVAAHPNIISAKQSIGTTIENRQIYVYKISNSPNADNGKPEVFYNAYIHAREPITFEIVYDLAQYLVNGYGSDPRATNIVDNRQIWIQPCVNPDGVEYNAQTNPSGGGMWRKNRRHNQDGSWGVDLNRNFGYMWGFDNNGSSPYGSDDTYRGTSAFSEPEIAAVRDFCNAHAFTAAVNNHAYGPWQLFAFGYDSVHPAEYDGLLALGYMRQHTSNYEPGTAWELLYQTNGDAADWMYGEQTTKPRIWTYITESGNGGDGFWPAPSRIVPICAENREANLKLAELGDDPMRVLPPGASVAAAPDTVPRTFTLQWTVPNPDPSNPATAWNLIEATGGSVGQDNVEGTLSNRWTPEGWSVTTSKSHSPTHSWWSGNGDGQNNLLISRRGHKVANGESLKFWTWYNLESGYDYGFVEVATDARHYTRIAGTITTNNDPNNRNPGNGITGSSGNQWVQATFNLAAYAGQTVWVRFRYNSDGYTANGGWYVDDVEPSDLFMNETSVATNLTSAQYTFTDHPEGVFSYLVQSVDGEGDQAIWSAPERVFIHGTTGAPEPVLAWRGLGVQGNPFRDSATLRWDVPASSRPGQSVRLAIHDVNGREIAVLRSGAVGSALAPGMSRSDRWAPEGMPSGLYFARLTVGGRVSEARLVYMK